MKLKNVKVGETYIIKSLDHTSVGYAPFKIGDTVVVKGFTDFRYNTVKVHGVWTISHKDLKCVNEPPIEYPHPMMEHLGKEVEVVVGDDCGVCIGMRGFVVSFSKLTNNPLIDFGDGFYGHNVDKTYTTHHENRTCWFVDVDDLKFLTEDDE